MAAPGPRQKLPHAALVECAWALVTHAARCLHVPAEQIAFRLARGINDNNHAPCCMGKDIETVHMVLAYIQAKQSRANVATLCHQSLPNMDADTLKAAVTAAVGAPTAWVDAVKAGKAGGAPTVAPPLTNCGLHLTDYLSKAEFVRRAAAIPTLVLAGALRAYTAKDAGDTAVDPTRRVGRAAWSARYPVLPVLSMLTLSQFYERYIHRLPPITQDGDVGLRPLQRAARIRWLTEEEEEAAAKLVRAPQPRSGRGRRRRAASSTMMSQSCMLHVSQR